MNKYKTIPDFLEDLDEEQKKQVVALRKCIMSVEPTLEENIKWNAPNYVHKGIDRITFNTMNKEGKVTIILHKGAKEKEDKKAPPIMKDDTGLIHWNSNIRGTLVFNSLSDIEKNKETLRHIIKKWLSL